MNQHIKERGQVLVLIILAIAAIFGFAALAVDIGRTYSERRRAQSAADAAAYAAAFAGTQGENYMVAGRNSVRLNGFEDIDLGENSAAEMDVQIYNPPQTGKYATATETIDPAEYFQVIIRLKVKPVFSQFVYQGPLELTVESIARGTPALSFASGASIVATCPDCCNAVNFSGTANVIVDGGNIVSNSTMGLEDKDKCESAAKDGDPCVTLTDGKIIAGGTFDDGKSVCNLDGTSRTAIIGTIDEKSSELWEDPKLGTPGCVDKDGNPLPTVNTSNYANVGTTPGSPLVLSPGIYPNGISISGVQSVVWLDPGMYCLDGDLNVSSGSLYGEGVMFVMRQQAPNKPSSININTSQPVSLSAPGKNMVPPDDCIPDPTISAGYCWSGFLVYMPFDNGGTISFAGGNTSSYTGTIYAPGPAKPDTKTKCTILGNADNISVNSSIICYTVTIGGNGTVDIEYQNDASAQKSAIVEMSK